MLGFQSSTRHILKKAALLVALAIGVNTIGVATVAAQTEPVPQSGNIYAVADLVSELDPQVGGSSALFESTSGGLTRVTVVLQNVRPNGRYDVDIRRGSCGGDVVRTLQPVVSDANGSGRSVTEIQGGVEFGVWHVAAITQDDASRAVPLCGSVNPALAAPPVANPGMPRTGSPIDLSVLLMLVGAGLVVLAGLRVRTKSVKSS